MVGATLLSEPSDNSPVILISNQQQQQAERESRVKFAGIQGQGGAADDNSSAGSDLTSELDVEAERENREKRRKEKKRRWRRHFYSLMSRMRLTSPESANC